MASKIECPKCKNNDFLVKTEVDLMINPETNFGKMKYGWITKVVCANIECGHDMSDEEGVGTDVIIGMVKNLIIASTKETLLIK